jgi:hypothetical protein
VAGIEPKNDIPTINGMLIIINNANGANANNAK